MTEPRPEAIIPAMMGLLEDIAPTLPQPAIDRVLATFENIIPLGIELPEIKGIIQLIRHGNQHATVGQVVRLQELDQKCDTPPATAANEAEEPVTDQETPATGDAEGQSGQ